MIKISDIVTTEHVPGLSVGGVSGVGALVPNRVMKKTQAGHTTWRFEFDFLNGVSLEFKVSPINVTGSVSLDSGLNSVNSNRPQMWYEILKMGGSSVQVFEPLWFDVYPSDFFNNASVICCGTVRDDEVSSEMEAMDLKIDPPISINPQFVEVPFEELGVEIVGIPAVYVF